MAGEKEKERNQTGGKRKEGLGLEFDDEQRLFTFLLTASSY